MASNTHPELSWIGSIYDNIGVIGSDKNSLSLLEFLYSRLQEEPFLIKLAAVSHAAIDIVPA